MTEDTAAHLIEWGEELTWTPAGGVAASLTAIFTDAFATEPDDQFEVEVHEAKAETETSRITGMASDDRITARGRNYVVDRVRPDAVNPNWSHIYLARA